MTEQMLLPDEDALIIGLGERGLPFWGTPVVAPQVAALRSPLREAFLLWWHTGNVPDVSIHEQSAQSLVDSGFHPLAALLSLDALERNPVAVKVRLQRGQEKFVPVAFGAPPTNSSKENV